MNLIKHRGPSAAFALLLCLPVIAATARAQSRPKTVLLTMPRNAGAPAQFGADALRDALTKHGLQISTGTGLSSPDLRVIVSERDRDAVNAAGDYRRAPDRAESYAITVSSDKRTFYIDGSDATGTMYGELDLAEQAGMQQGDNWASGIKAVSKSPFLEIRGVNMFLTVQDLEEPNGAFWSDEYWKTYLDIMARNRYNFLDIHGPCDAVTLTFPNGFSYFVSLPDFPEVGVGARQAARNLARFRQVIQMASDRGIRVGYMNYEASPPIGPWKTRQFGVDERWTNRPQEFLTGPRLEIYTREAVLSFLQQLPELWMFGFRVGESGQPEDFYEKTYVAALAKLPPTLKVYLRTWIADPQKVRELAASLKNPLYIEPKYNGEQLGLPYQAALGGREYPPSGSYENYTDKPMHYSIIWQIRAHGTHRVFYWGSPEFARRTVRSCKFGDGLGFSMEPMEAYNPAADYLHNNPKVDHHFYRWMVEREWVWHLIWGRTAYDPDVSNQVFISEFARRFGSAAGPLIFQALAESSKIVPFVYSYHNVGLDHQDFAPEFENGDHAPGVRSRLWQGTRLVPYGGDNDDFLRVNTLDRTAMASPSVYVDNRLQGIVTGQMTPLEAAGYLDNAAAKSELEIDQAAKLNPEDFKNFDCIRLDIKAVAWLGRYYRDRILSATHLRFYERTFDHPELTLAYEYLTRAVSDWDNLSQVTEEHFGYVPEYIRMGVKQFQWRDEGRALGVDLDQIDTLEAAFRRLPDQDGLGVVLGHVPPVKAEPGKPLTLRATFATSSDHPRVYVFFRNSHQTGYTKLELTLDDKAARTWSVVIPADQIVPGYVDYYFGANSGRWGDYGETIAQRPPYHVLVNTNDEKPILSYTPPHTPERGASVNLAVQVHAKARIKSVYVYYKPMPSYYEWVRMAMNPQTDGNYVAAVPLTPEGILYYFEASDEDGNAANYPNFLNRTPYFAIDSWAPSANLQGVDR